MSRRIGDAALVLFARHGFARTSMADIAREAQVARATVHLAFRDKTALFEHLAGQLVDDTLAAAAQAWAAGADDPAEARLARALLAADLPLFRLLHASPHGSELLSLDAELTRRHAERLDDALEAMIAQHLAAIAGLDPSGFGTWADAAQFVRTASAGLKHSARNEAVLAGAVAHLAFAVVSALGGAKGVGRGRQSPRNALSPAHQQTGT